MGERVTAADVPVPVSEIVCGLPVTLSVTEILPVALPLTVGAKLTLIAQELPADTVEPQLLVSEKPELAAIPEMVSAAVPLFVRVAACVWLDVPTG